MPTHALLGATGGTGSAVLHALLAAPPPNLTLKIFVRSKSRLLLAYPNLESTTSISISIFEAPITDISALRSCLSGAEVAHMCIATNEVKYGTHIAQDMAGAIISSLSQLREEQGSEFTKPTLLIIRSASLNPVYALHAGRVIHHLIMLTLHFVYNDLDKAASIYATTAAQERELFDYIFVDPPAIHDAASTHCTGHELMVDGSRPLSASLNYADLGAAFVELAQEKEHYLGKGVAVSATGAVREQWSVLLGYNWQGLKSRIWQ